jgi:oxygen-independent coproporphyrinogen III oxidase
MLDYSEPLSIYIHIPFCKRRCGYCDFNTFAGKETLIPSYFDALQKELKDVAHKFNTKPSIRTLFFGGGTPSIIPIQQYYMLFSILHDLYLFQDNVEISMEANPGSTSIEYLKSLRNLGINRLSLGAQSTDEFELKLLNRIHNRKDIFNSFKYARKANFQNINIDLMFGLPFQEMKLWKKSLAEIIALNPEHLSLYALSIEIGTPFFTRVKSADFTLPDNDSSADMYEWAREQLENKSFKHYEISNWAKDGFECLHNKQYWYNNNYIGIGSGAHSQFNGNRYSNVGSLINYVRRIKQGINSLALQEKEFPFSSAIQEYKSLNKKDRMLESMMLGLRLTEEGVSTKNFLNRYDEDLEKIYQNEINDLIKKELIEWKSDSIKLTKRGQFIGNNVFLKFIGQN